MTKVLCALLIFFSFNFLGCKLRSIPTNQITDVKKFLSDIPLEERLLLEYFFRSLIQEEPVGYVLLGEKPMSFHSYLKPKAVLPSFLSEPMDALNLFFEGFQPHEALFQKGWDTWKKYHHYFCGNNIFFDKIEQNLELHYVKIVVINKCLMFHLLDQHLSKFQEIDPLIKDKKSFFNALLHKEKFKAEFYLRDDLLGLCLGYGERNAILFKKMATVFGLLTLKKNQFSLILRSPNRLKELKEEWDVFEKDFKPLRDNKSRKFLFTFGVGFRADYKDPETFLLQKKYRTCREMLTQQYENTNFLEKTLELLIFADRS